MSVIRDLSLCNIILLPELSLSKSSYYIHLDEFVSFQSFISRPSALLTPRQKKQKLCLNRLKKQELVKVAKFFLRKKSLRYNIMTTPELSHSVRAVMSSLRYNIMTTRAVTLGQSCHVISKVLYNDHTRAVMSSLRYNVMTTQELLHQSCHVISVIYVI